MKMNEANHLKHLKLCQTKCLLRSAPRNGFVMADVVSLRTLLIKIPGLMLSVAAGSRFRDLGNHFLTKEHV